ncbi:hypothetical protein [Nocardia sp. NPDC056100]|uniref:hypothetical protein n=1 Tax=Nocardia sp. NPDC056100 TaxID=3345712 RepID=UPI0035DC0900
MNTHQPTESGQETRDDDPVVPAFIPTLLVMLISLEERKVTDLTEAELLDARDNAPVMMLPLSIQHEVNKSRGYRDIDPDNLWQEWCLYKSGEDPFTLADDHL